MFTNTLKPLKKNTQREKEKQHDENNVRLSFDEKGFSVRKEAERNRAIRETLDLKHEADFEAMVNTVNGIGRHMADEIKMPKWVKKSNKLSFVQTMVSV